MTEVALRLGPLNVGTNPVVRSGWRWLCEPGHMCRRGEVIAFCNVGLLGQDSNRFGYETRDLQVAVASPISGRLRRDSATFGGWQNLLPVTNWTADEVLGYLEPDSGQRDEADGVVQLLMMAGRRVTGLAEDRSGLLTGWHARSRVCHVDGNGPIGTLLGLGVCEMLGIIKGESFAFLELFSAIEGPAQVVFVADYCLTPSARILAEQIRRTTKEIEAIRQDLSTGLAGSGVIPDAADLMFAGAFLNALLTSHATERYRVLTRGGIRSVGPPDAIILSLHAENSAIMRHRKLGYSISCYPWRLADAGRAFPHWLRAHFEPVRRTVADVHRDYCVLIDLIRTQAPATQILISNMMSTSGSDDVHSYAGFDAPIGETLASVHSKDMNLMLYDLARERDIAIVDADAIAAELGARSNLHDEVHQSGAMQAELRAEILRILRARSVSGFGSSEAKLKIIVEG
jgi:hypothetical protein